MKVAYLQQNETYRDWEVVAVFDEIFVANNTDWLTNGIPVASAPGHQYIDVTDIEGVSVGAHLENGVYTSDRTISRLRIDKTNEIADARWHDEVAPLDFESIIIDGSRESRRSISDEAVRARAYPGSLRTWKTLSGFVSFTADHITRIDEAFAQRTQSLFDREATLALQIAEADVDVLDTIVWE